MTFEMCLQSFKVLSSVESLMQYGMVMHIVRVCQGEVSAPKNLVLHHADATPVLLLIICCEIQFTTTNTTTLSRQNLHFFHSCASVCHILYYVNFLYTNALTS